MFDIVSYTISHIYEVLAFADISFLVSFGVIFVALGFLGKLASPKQL